MLVLISIIFFVSNDSCQFQLYSQFMKEKLKEQKLFFISIIFMMLFSFPFLKMINAAKFIAGIPQFYFFIFIFWFAAIFLIWLVADTHRKKTRQQKDE